MDVGERIDTGGRQDTGYWGHPGTKSCSYSDRDAETWANRGLMLLTNTNKARIYLEKVHKNPPDLNKALTKLFLFSRDRNILRDKSSSSIVS